MRMKESVALRLMEGEEGNSRPVHLGHTTTVALRVGTRTQSSWVHLRPSGGSPPPPAASGRLSR